MGHSLGNLQKLMRLLKTHLLKYNEAFVRVMRIIHNDAICKYTCMFKIQIQLRIRDNTNGCIIFITLLITNFSTFFDAKNYVGEKNVMNIIREQESCCI